MIYCDTSLIVASLTGEPASGVADRWLDSYSRTRLAVSPWTATEVASALAMKRRVGVFDQDEQAEAQAAWRRWYANGFELLAVAERHFSHAERLVIVGARGLRASDALHLAIAVDYGCELATFDRDLADAATSLGIAVHPADL